MLDAEQGSPRSPARSELASAANEENSSRNHADVSVRSTGLIYGRAGVIVCGAMRHNSSSKGTSVSGSVTGTGWEPCVAF